MDAVILFSHGSLLCGAGLALEQHAEWLRRRHAAPIVEIGYLNYSEPLFADAVERCAAAGATRIVVAPYFLVSGYFVETALPTCIDRARHAHPGPDFIVTAPIGYDVRLADALLACADAAGPRERWRDDLATAAAHCRQRPQCPLFGTQRCPKQPVLADDGITAPGIQADPGATAALLIMAHGSPNHAADADTFRIAELLRARREDPFCGAAGAAASVPFDIIEPGFLECSEPSIPETIDACVASGAASVTAVPYFLHAGKHVAEDLPALLDAARSRWPSCTFRLGPYIGRDPRLADILADRIATTLAAVSR
ncbi:MAG TPA: CbiX/SirB N-terminal domain-containing protein [Chthonomonadaceae bacterium]|nr:CbiX/SirB N-terminal domain-containing protein [Chthonomonadaceae bacterium]